MKIFGFSATIALWTGLFAIPTAALAQTGTIQGTVRTHQNDPAPYANVLIRETNVGTTTESDGTFTLSNVEEGTYTVVLSFVGYQTQEKTIGVYAGKTTEISFKLSETAQQLSEVTVSDARSVNERQVNIGKAGIRSMDLPQSVLLIDEELLKKQQVLRLSDALMNANGVYVMGNTGGTQEELAGRGFAYGSNNTFKNGARFNNAIMPETSGLEKIEILKGSNAILFGNVAAGGVLNLVTKKPKFESGGELSMRIGSYDLYKPALDVYGPLNDSKVIAYRINTTYENSRSFRDEVKGERIYFNPSFLIRAGKKTEILVEGDYLKDDRTLDYGIGAINYQLIDVPRNRFVGAPWSYFNGEQKSLTTTITHVLNRTWQLKGMVSYQGFNSDIYGTTRPNAGNFVQADGTWARGLQRSESDQEYFLAQIDLTGSFKTGSINHALLFGADADKYRNTTTAYLHQNPLINNANVYDTVNILNPALRTQRRDIPALALNTRTSNPINRTGVYVQDLITLTEHIKFLGGVRYSYIESDNNVFSYATSKETPNAYYDHIFTPRFGLVYQPLEHISVFTSYANSFNLNTGTDLNAEPLPPSMIDQFEVGIKSELLKGLLSANITAYEIINSNLAQGVQVIPEDAINKTNPQELAGEVTSKGIEVDITSKPVKGFSFIAGYSYNDTRYTKSSVYEKDSKLRYNPNHTANISLFYTFTGQQLKGLNAGLTGFYFGDRMAGRSTTEQRPDYRLIPVPSFFQLDASVGYTFKKVSARVKVSNILNELSYHVHDDNSVNPIAPRIFTTTLAYKW